MRDIINFLKQNMKYSLGIIVFGLIFAFSFQANKVQIPQIPKELIRIVPGAEEAEQYLISGWQDAYVKGKSSILKVVLPERRTYRMVIKAFSCSSPDVRDQRIEVHFNNVALDRLKFRKTPKWQKFSVHIPPYLLQESNTIKFVYTQDTSLSPIAFKSLEFRNHIFRIKGLYLLIDSNSGRTDYLTSRAVSFAILFWLFWLFYSRFLSFAVRMKFFRATRIDFLSYLPSIVLLSLLALISFFSPYHFVYSLKIFFILTIVPTAVLKLFPYKDLSPRFIIELLQPVFRFILRIEPLTPVSRFIPRDIEKTCLETKKAYLIIKIKIIKPIFRFILRDVEKTCLETKKAYLACLPFFSFLKRQVTTFRKFLVRYHKTNLSSAFVLDFMLLLVLCAFLLTVKESIATWIADRLASLAYFLLAVGVIMKIVQIRKERR